MVNMLGFIFEVETLIALLSMLIACVFRDTKWFLFSSLVGVSLFLSWVIESPIKLYDTQGMYRYMIYSFIEVLFIFCMYKLWCEEYILDSHFVLSLTLSFILLCTYLFRHIDRHYLDLAYSSQYYKVIIPTINGMFSLACFFPLVNRIFNFISSKKLKNI